MHPEILRARSDTIRQWATEIERDPNKSEGMAEVAFLLERATRIMNAAAAGVDIDIELISKQYLTIPVEHLPEAETDG